MTARAGDALSQAAFLKEKIRRNPSSCCGVLYHAIPDRRSIRASASSTGGQLRLSGKTTPLKKTKWDNGDGRGWVRPMLHGRHEPSVGNG